jgi:YHS domain-containing protein
MMGSEIKDEASAVGHVDYEGVRYYLCCDMCVEPANKDPKAMAEKAAKL